MYAVTRAHFGIAPTIGRIAKQARMQFDLHGHGWIDNADFAVMAQHPARLAHGGCASAAANAVTVLRCQFERAMDAPRLDEKIDIFGLPQRGFAIQLFTQPPALEFNPVDARSIEQFAEFSRSSLLSQFAPRIAGCHLFQIGDRITLAIRPSAPRAVQQRPDPVTIRRKLRQLHARLRCIVRKLQSQRRTKRSGELAQFGRCSQHGLT